MKQCTIITLGILLTLFTSCTATDHKKNAPAEGKNHKIAKHYTCTMHPGVLTDKPGLCPKCGMELVEKDN